MKNNIHTTLTVLILFAQEFLTACTQEKASSPEERLNILLIVADDTGFSDFSCYGGEIPTPNVDSLATEGTLFTDFNVVSLAEVLNLYGYHTYMASMWHLGARMEDTRPYARGFSRTFSMLAGGVSHWSDNAPLIPGKPSPYTVNGKVIDKLPEDFYSSKNYVDSIISYIDSHATGEKLFFAYLSFTAPHNPLHAPKEYIEKYRGKYDRGWVEIAKDMEVYAAMIDYMDMSIGRLMTYLKKINQYDNTLIVFLSDNGASKTTIMDYASLGDEVASYLESFDNSTENNGLPNSATDIGPGWAWAANTPFRLTKGYPTEGGMRVPCVIKMPGEFPASPKRISGFAYVYDLMPTILELAQADHSSEYNGTEVLPMQGSSLLPVLSGESTDLTTREFGFEIYGMSIFRSGPWKIMKMPVPYGTGRWQLYNLQDDLSEQKDLSGEFPEIFAELKEKYNTYTIRNGIVPPDRPVGYAMPPKQESY